MWCGVCVFVCDFLTFTSICVGVYVKVLNTVPSGSVTVGGALVQPQAKEGSIQVRVRVCVIDHVTVT